MDQNVKLFVEFLSQLQGPSTEIVLYNCKTNEREVLYNGAATGRNMVDGDYMTELESLKSLAEEAKNFIVGYKGKSVNDQNLRVSNLFIRDEKGTLNYILCVNQNVTELERFQDFLNYFTNPVSTPRKAMREPDDNVEKLMDTLIQNEVEYMKLSGLDISTREARYEILKNLNEKGIFDIKGSVSKVCEILNISQATLYNNLKEINKATEK